MKDNVTVKKLVKKDLPRINFSDIKNKILGKKYELSLVFVGKTKIQELNKNYRNKNEPTDILSFQISKNEGEVFINPDMARKKSKDFNQSYKKYLVYLVIHGLLHLKGMEHGSRMEKAEIKFLKKFNP